MGVWATAISDDDAADIRNDYRDLIADGYSGPEATDKILSTYAGQTEDGVLRLALAATQWNCGRLEDRVKNHALEIIDSSSDLLCWEADDPKLVPRRRKVLERLRQQLLSPQGPPAKIKKQFKNSCNWEVGEVLAYDLPSGKKVLFRVLGHHTDHGGTFPACEFLDRSGEENTTNGSC